MGYFFDSRSPSIMQKSRALTPPQARLGFICHEAKKFRTEILAQPPVPYYESFDLVRVPYPTKYGFLNAIKTIYPYLHILNRMFIVQFWQKDRFKTLLISPSDIERNTITPYFARLAAPTRAFKCILDRLLAPRLAAVETCLQRVGIMPEQVDYISYDHLHTQDLRRWLGDGSNPGVFPNAKLLVMKDEWEAAQGLLPHQSDWYCPQGTTGIPQDRIILLDGDVFLGDGVALIQTPGHTAGNHSFVVHTDAGLLVTSENGIGADAYAPLHSKIWGVKQYAKATNMAVILNGNTLENSTEQYLSMILEREVAGKCLKNNDFYNVVNSSEFSHSWLFPGLRPSFQFGALRFGKPTLLQNGGPS